MVYLACWSFTSQLVCKCSMSVFRHSIYSANVSRSLWVVLFNLSIFLFSSQLLQSWCMLYTNYRFTCVECAHKRWYCVPTTLPPYSKPSLELLHLHHRCVMWGVSATLWSGNAEHELPAVRCQFPYVLLAGSTAGCVRILSTNWLQDIIS